jgi:hypothetical protein
MLTISSTKLAAVIKAAQQCEVDVLRSITTVASLPGPAAEIPVAHSYRRALVTLLRSLNNRELEDLVALAWIGRGDFAPEEWSEASSLAHDFQKSCKTECLSTLPLLPEYIEEALDRLKSRQLETAS